MLPLGSVLLSAVLLGVPRALDSRAFGAARSVYVQVAEADPDLADFAAELARAIDGAAYTLVTDRSRATLVVEVHRLWRSSAGSGTKGEAVSCTVRRGHDRRPLVLHYRPETRMRAARTLVQSLAGFDSAPA